MRSRDDAELLQALATALKPVPARPTVAELAVLHDALAARSGESELSSRAETSSPAFWRNPSVRAQGVHRLRRPAGVLLVAGVLATSGVAAAVGTNTLPGPARVVAFDLGLPVSSPALVTAQGAVATLRVAVVGSDVAAVRFAADSLRRDMAALTPSDHQKVEPEADQLLFHADERLEASAPDGKGTEGGTKSRGGSPSDDGSSGGVEHSGGSTHGEGNKGGQSSTSVPGNSGASQDGGQGKGGPDPGDGPTTGDSPSSGPSDDSPSTAPPTKGSPGGSSSGGGASGGGTSGGQSTGGAVNGGSGHGDSTGSGGSDSSGGGKQ
jgi:hypothetical protein